ncbi:MAG TPA: hypothetical protein VE914_23710 [Candidatus Angelobacter sp.]|nr:hypothetical protein [Candidatus Angelobacter sp.]
MRYLIVVALMVGGCSEAEMSATTPAPKANFVAFSNTSEADATAEATRVCRYYHSEPAALVDRTGANLRFECTGRARGDEPMFFE